MSDNKLAKFLNGSKVKVTPGEMQWLESNGYFPRQIVISGKNYYICINLNLKIGV